MGDECWTLDVISIVMSQCFYSFIALRFFHHESLSFQKWIFDSHLFYALTMLHIFAVQGFTACFESCGNNQGIVKTILVAGLDIQATPVKRNIWVNAK